jgi:hypothetical protein
MLLFCWVITELPRVAVPVNIGIVPDVPPLVVTAVWAPAAMARSEANTVTANLWIGMVYVLSSAYDALLMVLWRIALAVFMNRDINIFNARARRRLPHSPLNRATIQWL